MVCVYVCGCGCVVWVCGVRVWCVWVCVVWGCVWCVCRCVYVCGCGCMCGVCVQFERAIHNTPRYISFTLHSHLFPCLLILLFSYGTFNQNFTCMSYFHSSKFLTYHSSSKNNSSYANSRSYWIILSHFEKQCNFPVLYSVSGRNFG